MSWRKTSWFLPLCRKVRRSFDPGKLNILDQEAADRENAQTVNMEAMKNFRFIQNFRDEFLELGEKEKRSVFSWENLNVSVITNSDYIMGKRC